MAGIIDTLVISFRFPIVRYAMVVGPMIALCSSLLGVTLVLRRHSLIGSGLSHVAFGAAAIAAAMNLTNNMLFVLPATIICAVLLLRTGRNAKIKGDAAIAMISVGALSVGYLILNIFPRSANLAGDVCTILFGAVSILTLTVTDVWISSGLSALVTAVFLLFYNKIFAITFDEDFAEATGNRAKMYNLILAVVIAVVIVLAMDLVGALLITALVIFPAVSAMRVFKSFKTVTICAVIVSVMCAVLGMLISIVSGTPVGATIVTANIAVFGIFCAAGLIRRRE
jgi:zinc transport system permease protein